jgi:glucose-1-phosphate thymidylyltransferase
MQAIILAAGKGSRLSPLTDNLPKPLIDIQGIPILERLLSTLPKSITEVIIVTEYLEEKIKGYIGDWFNDIDIVYAHQGEQKGTLGALISAKEYIKEEPFLVIGSDDLFSKEELEEIVLNELAFGVHKKILTWERMAYY